MNEVFEKLSQIDVSEFTEKKKVGNAELTYLSWAHAWRAVKQQYPDAQYEIVKDEFCGQPYAFDEKTGYMVYTRVTIEGLTHEMWLPVMDGTNHAMKAEPYDYKVKNPNFKYAKLQEDGRYVDKYGNEQPEFLVKHVEAATMFDVNKTIMRCLVKNLAMFGLGLYIYAGEDLPTPPDGEVVDYKASVAHLLKDNGVDVKSLEAWKDALPEKWKNVDLGGLSEDGWHAIYDEILKKG